MTAPRIDAVRAEIRDTVRLLQAFGDQLDDLHVLAYNRHRAAKEAKVRGGSRDYALDNHGDPEARRLYDQAARDLHATLNRLVGTMKETRGYLTAKGSHATRRDSSADASAIEVLGSIAAQARRRKRGDYTPAPLVDQPQVHTEFDWHTEVEALRSAVRKVTAAFLADHQTCQATQTDWRGQRLKLTRRYQTKLLTPRERDAWRRVDQSVSDSLDGKAS